MKIIMYLFKINNNKNLKNEIIKKNVNHYFYIILLYVYLNYYNKIKY